MIFIVTGSEGFIGKEMVKLLVQNGHYVYGIDKLTYASKQFYENRKDRRIPNYKLIIEDIKNITKLPDCDYIINFAAESHVDNSIGRATEFLESNVIGVENLLNLCKTKYKKPIFIQISTDEVYGETSHSANIIEEIILNPGNPYSASKAAADMLVFAWHKTHNIKYLIIRPANNYGLEQYPEKLIPKTIQSYLIGNKLELHNNGEPYRTWLHVKDTASAIYKIIKSGQINQIYNISSDDVLQNIEVVKTIFNILNNDKKTYKDVKEFLDLEYSRPGQDVFYHTRDDKLKALGWSNLYLFREEIEPLVKEYVRYFYKNGVIY